MIKSTCAVLTAILPYIGARQSSGNRCFFSGRPSGDQQAYDAGVREYTFAMSYEVAVVGSWRSVALMLGRCVQRVLA